MLDVKSGQIYVCTKSDRPWWTKGKEYEVVLNKYGELCFVDDGAKWTINYLNNMKNYQFKLVKTPPEVTMNDSKANTVGRKYTPFEVNKVILKSYQMYNNDAQRLAFIKGYFAK
jgi:hypothetical protein